jgi:diguanylate cyclase (GGDEF)-like protein/PAS domain S-box-containing protein
MINSDEFTTDKFYEQIIQKMPFGYAFHKVIYEKKRPVDYIFLDVNESFEKITGLKKEKLINTAVTEVIPGIKEDEFNWIEFYGKIAMESKTETIQQFSTVLNKWFQVQIFSPKKEFFITVFLDISDEIKQQDELNNFFDINLDMLCIADTSGHFLKINKEWENVLGFSIEQLMQGRFLDFVHPEDIHNTIEAMKKLKNQESVLSFTNRYRCKDNSYKYIEWRSIPSGSKIYAAARDITDRVLNTQRLKKQAEYNKIMAETSTLFMRTNKDNLDYTIKQTLKKAGIYFNFDRVYIFQYSDTVKEKTHQWLNDNIKSDYPLHRKSPIHDTPWLCKKISHQDNLCLKNISDLPEEASDEKKIFSSQKVKSVYIIPLRSNQKTEGYFGFETIKEYKILTSEEIQVLEMVSNIISEGMEKIKMEEKIKEISIRDPLTNIYNRRYIISRLSEIVDNYSRTKSSFTLTIFDLDHFKQVNDKYGHLAGDYVLKKFSAILEKNMRSYDLIGRYGGEEFIAINPDTSKKEAHKIYDRTLEKIRKMTFRYKGEIQITFSAGIAESSEINNNLTIEKIIDLADKRCYKAKKKGRNRIEIN